MLFAPGLSMTIQSLGVIAERIPAIEDQQSLMNSTGLDFNTIMDLIEPDTGQVKQASKKKPLSLLALPSFWRLGSDVYDSPSTYNSDCPVVDIDIGTIRYYPSGTPVDKSKYNYYTTHGYSTSNASNLVAFQCSKSTSIWKQADLLRAIGDPIVNEVVLFMQTRMELEISDLKSILQKLMRHSPKIVDYGIDGGDAKTEKKDEKLTTLLLEYPGVQCLIATFVVLLCHASSYSPEQHKKITGPESAYKRVAVTAVEDSYVTIKQRSIIVQLLACTAVSQIVQSWQPPIHLVLSFIQCARELFHDDRTMVYDTTIGCALPPIVVNSSTNSTLTPFEISSWLLDGIGGMAGDLGMFRHLAKTCTKSDTVKSKVPTLNCGIDVFPITDAIDQHISGSLVYFVNPALLVGPFSSVSSSSNVEHKGAKTYGSFFSALFVNHTGVNRRKPLPGSVTTTPTFIQWIKGIRAAQRLYARFKWFRQLRTSNDVGTAKITKLSSSGVIDKKEVITYVADDAYLAGMFAPMVIKIKVPKVDNNEDNDDNDDVDETSDNDSKEEKITNKKKKTKKKRALSTTTQAFQVFINPKKIEEKLVMTLPKRGKIRGDVEAAITQVTKDLVIETFMNEHLHRGVKLDACTPPVPIPIGQALYCRWCIKNCEYQLFVTHPNYAKSTDNDDTALLHTPWNKWKNVEYELQINNQSSLSKPPSFAEAMNCILTTRDNLTLAPVNHKALLNQLLNETPMATLHLINNTLLGFNTTIEFPRISRDGSGVKVGKVAFGSTAVYQFLCRLSIIYPMAIQLIVSHHGTFEKFRLPIPSLFWSIRDEILAFTQRNDKQAALDCTRTWLVPVKSVGKKPSYPADLRWYQRDILQHLVYQQNAKGSRGEYIPFPTGTGKTPVVLERLTDMWNEKKLPPYIFWIGPDSSVLGIVKQLETYQGLPIHWISPPPPPPDTEKKGVKKKSKSLSKSKQWKYPAPKPGHVNIVYHHHLIYVIDQLLPLVSQSFLVMDEVHKFVTVCQRSSAGVQLILAAKYFLNLTGTPDVVAVGGMMDINRAIVPFPCTLKNYFVQYGMMFTVAIVYPMESRSREIALEWSSTELKNKYQSHIPIKLGGTHPRAKRDDVRQGVDMCMDHATQQLVEFSVNHVNRTLVDVDNINSSKADEYKAIGRTWPAVLIEAWSRKHQLQIVRLLMNKHHVDPSRICVMGKKLQFGISNSDDDDVNDESSITYATSLLFNEETVLDGTSTDYHYVIANVMYGTDGWDATAARLFVRLPSPSNNRTNGRQLQGRIRRMNSTALYLDYITMYLGIQFIRHRKQQGHLQTLQMLDDLAVHVDYLDLLE